MYGIAKYLAKMAKMKLLNYSLIEGRTCSSLKTANYSSKMICRPEGLLQIDIDRTIHSNKSNVLVIEGQRTCDLAHNLFSIDKKAKGIN